MKTLKILSILTFSIIFYSCGESDTIDRGIGPIKKVEIGPLDKQLAQKGAEIFREKCTACHKYEERYVAPPLKGVTERRSPEFIMNMIINPEEMAKKNPTVRALLAEYMTQMTNQNINEQDARALLEHLREIDGAK